MTHDDPTPQNDARSDEQLAIHLLGVMSTHHRRECRCTPALLCADSGLDGATLDRLLSALETQGLIDAALLRPTLAGFAIGVAASSRLPPKRARAAAAA